MQRKTDICCFGTPVGESLIFTQAERKILKHAATILEAIRGHINDETADSDDDIALAMHTCRTLADAGLLELTE